MRDPITASRLPDLPNAGYATTKEKAVSDVVMEWLRQIERNRILLLKIVADGPYKWRKTAGGKWRGAYLDTDFLNAIFGYMELLAGPNPRQQYERLVQMKNAPAHIGNNAALYEHPIVRERRVRDSLAFVEAIRRNDRSVKELKRRG